MHPAPSSVNITTSTKSRYQQHLCPLASYTLTHMHCLPLEVAPGTFHTAPCCSWIVTYLPPGRDCNQRPFRSGTRNSLSHVATLAFAAAVSAWFAQNRPKPGIDSRTTCCCSNFNRDQNIDVTLRGNFSDRSRTFTSCTLALPILPCILTKTQAIISGALKFCLRTCM